MGLARTSDACIISPERIVGRFFDVCIYTLCKKRRRNHFYQSCLKGKPVLAHLALILVR
jgi:hypothetical protein